ncbi:MAG: phosphatase PAP2 family protein [Nocardioides sp.]
MPPPPPRVRLSAAAALLPGYGAIAARPGDPGRRERALFALVNGMDQRVELRVAQQWGIPWTLPLVAAIAAARRRPRHAAVALLAVGATKGVEVATKKVRPRPRPLYVQPTALRDDAPLEGGSMPSGHAAVGACATMLLAPLVPAPVTAVTGAVTLLSALARVQQGAHEPLDAVAGLMLGSGIGLLGLELCR